MTPQVQEFLPVTKQAGARRVIESKMQKVRETATRNRQIKLAAISLREDLCVAKNDACANQGFWNQHCLEPDQAVSRYPCPMNPARGHEQHTSATRTESNTFYGRRQPDRHGTRPSRCKIKLMGQVVIIDDNERVTARRYRKVADC
jgi:hypothetical protein